ncbi:heat-inducible transcriptional repressor HrcA [Spiroplasma endosymbiont of Anurida maritima]|uniref:heat-inducible transcriptional repressor HrcA n=1 Tax=Spiroplasma endosymbiont of Anurida maritima TaxID=2967972 RepID=UPI0036D2A9E3
MLSTRQRNILKIIIEEYTRTAQPVGSKTILESNLLDASSATIRNECVTLGKEGYLEKEHTSSGRIPSTKGYRYYVDYLMDKKNVDDLKVRIETIFEDRSLTIDDILNQTGEILSEMTNLATVVVDKNNLTNYIRKIEMLKISNTSAVVIFVLSSGHVENKTFVFNEENKIDDLKRSIEIINERLSQTTLENILEKFEAIRPILQQQVKNYELIFKQFVNALTSINAPSHSKHGVHYMLTNPEYNTPEKIKEIITFIETVSPFEFFKKSQNNKNGKSFIDVKIGEEGGFENNNVSLITTSYQEKDGSEKSLVVLGPKRIEYDRIYNILEWLNEKIQGMSNNNQGDENE